MPDTDIRSASLSLPLLSLAATCYHTIGSPWPQLTTHHPLRCPTVQPPHVVCLCVRLFVVSWSVGTGINGYSGPIHGPHANKLSAANTAGIDPFWIVIQVCGLRLSP